MSKNSSLGVDLNNFGNIRYSEHNGFIGLDPETPNVKGFCHFTESIYGIRALCVILRTYMRKGVCTIESIITRYAPPSENNTSNYIRYVSGHIGKALDIDYYPIDSRIYWQSSIFPYLVQAIIWYEVNVDCPLGEIYDAIGLMDI